MYLQALAGLQHDEQQWQAFLHYCQVPPSTLQVNALHLLEVHHLLQVQQLCCQHNTPLAHKHTEAIQEQPTDKHVRV